MVLKSRLWLYECVCLHACLSVCHHNVAIQSVTAPPCSREGYIEGGRDTTNIFQNTRYIVLNGEYIYIPLVGQITDHEFVVYYYGIDILRADIFLNFYYC